jgi:hypothetical protein
LTNNGAITQALDNDMFKQLVDFFTANQKIPYNFKRYVLDIIALERDSAVRQNNYDKLARAQEWSDWIGKFT